MIDVIIFFGRSFCRGNGLRLKPITDVIYPSCYYFYHLMRGERSGAFVVAVVADGIRPGVGAYARETSSADVSRGVGGAARRAGNDTSGQMN